MSPETVEFAIKSIAVYLIYAGFIFGLALVVCLLSDDED